LMVQVVTLPSPTLALGTALHFVARREPFASFRAADLVSTVNGQVQRGHYRFAVDGQRVLGYVGWALYDADVAARAAAGGHPPPTSAMTQGADVVWILTAVSTTPAAFVALVRALRAAYPDLRMMGVRHKPGPHGERRERIVFDRRPCDDAPAGACGTRVPPRHALQALVGGA